MGDCCANCVYYDKESKHCVKTGFRLPHDHCNRYVKDIRPYDGQVEIGLKSMVISDSLNK